MNYQQSSRPKPFLSGFGAQSSEFKVQSLKSKEQRARSKAAGLLLRCCCRCGLWFVVCGVVRYRSKRCRAILGTIARQSAKGKELQSQNPFPPAILIRSPFFVSTEKLPFSLLKCREIVSTASNIRSLRGKSLSRINKIPLC